jgi:glucokinase
MSAANSYALGIDLGGSSVKAVAVTPEGKLLAETNVPFDVNEQLDWARRIQQIVDAMESGQGRAALGIGISAPGLAASDGRSIAVMPGRLSGLEGLDWTDFLCGKVENSESQPALDDSTYCASSSAVIPVLNDAHAALLGEAWLGAARGFRNVFMLTLGTGVGGAAMVDGRLLKGALGRAGHLGHISLDMAGPRDVCGMPGSLEAMVGNCTIEQRTGGLFKTTHELVEAHLRGDKEATEIWLRSVRALGYGISSLVNVLDPEAVIVGGGIARSGAALFEPLERFVRDTEWDVGAPIRILPAQLGELAGAYGAAWNGQRAAGVLPQP